MGDILNEAKQKLGTIDQNGYVWNVRHEKIGRVLDNGDVQNIKAMKIGSYEGNGYVFESGRKIGSVKSDGKVYDHEMDLIGFTKGDHMIGAGAALLLLFR